MARREEWRAIPDMSVDDLLGAAGPWLARICAPPSVMFNGIDDNAREEPHDD